MIAFFNNIDALRFLNNIEIVDPSIDLSDRVNESIHSRETVGSIQAKGSNSDLADIMCNGRTMVKRIQV